MIRIKNKPIPIPPFNEQKRIVSKIEALLPLVDRYAQAWNRLEDFNRRFPADLRKSILQMAIQGKLVEQRPEEGTGEELYRQIQREKQALVKAGKVKKQKALPEVTEDEVPFEVPESWKWVRWGDLSESIQYGYNAPAKKSGRIKMVRISDIQNGSVLWDTVPYCEIDEGEINGYLLFEFPQKSQTLKCQIFPCFFPQHKNLQNGKGANKKVAKSACGKLSMFV